jgi:flavin reductase (DIM6/NTAB) family NADH-FMN oxidoreductase RutF
MVSTAEPRIDGRLFREAFARVAGSVAVVLAGTPGQDVRAVTCTSAVPVSAEPPMALACLARALGITQLIRETARFSVNFLAGDRAATADAFAGRRPAPAAPHSVVVAGRTGVPTLCTGTVVVLECGLVAVHPGGDHEIVVGEIRHARVQHDAHILLHGERRYGRLTDEGG